MNTLLKLPVEIPHWRGLILILTSDKARGGTTELIASRVMHGPLFVIGGSEWLPAYELARILRRRTPEVRKVLKRLYTARASTCYRLFDTLVNLPSNGEPLMILDFLHTFYDPYITQFSQPDTIVSNPYNPQAWNRYAYVLRNPIRYNDPTGHVCSDPEDPTPTCYGSAGAQTRVGDRMIRGNGDELGKAKNKPDKVEKGDNSCGQEGIYSSRCPGWHFYTTTNLVCPAYLNCIADEMKDWFLRFAYPGQDPSQPVISGQSYSVSLCINDRCVPMAQYGAITVKVIDDFRTVNTTGPTHILYDGQIARHLYQAENGAWYVSTYGYGNNTIPGMDTMNQSAGPYIFNNLDEQMFQTIILNH